MSSPSASDRQQATIMRDRGRIARGERPTYHVAWSQGVDAIDVRIAELPLAHLFVPDEAGVPEGARALVARELEVPEDLFELEIAPRA